MVRQVSSWWRGGGTPNVTRPRSMMATISQRRGTAHCAAQPPSRGLLISWWWAARWWDLPVCPLAKAVLLWWEPGGGHHAHQPAPDGSSFDLPAPRDYPLRCPVHITGCVGLLMVVHDMVEPSLLSAGYGNVILSGGDATACPLSLV
jgi:hypothetical protein